MIERTGMILPLVLYLALIMGIAVWGNTFSRKKSDTAGFMEEYFIGSRSMGGFVLAMAVITTYISASSFVAMSLFRCTSITPSFNTSVIVTIPLNSLCSGTTACPDVDAETDTAADPFTNFLLRYFFGIYCFFTIITESN